MTKRNQVWKALKREFLDRPPQGEILIEDGWLRASGFQNLGEAVDRLQADMVVLPLVTRPQQSDTNWKEWATGDVFLFGSLQGPVTLFSEQLGWHAFSRLIIKQPGEAQSLIERYFADTVEQASAALDKGCEGIVVFDDLAGDKGLLINPKFLQNVYFPLLKKALERLGANKVPVIFHSDGNVLSLVPSLRETGFWGIQGLQPSVGLTPALFQEMKDWVYWGNFEFEGQGRLKCVSEVEHDVAMLLNQWRDFPGFLFGSSGGIYRGLPLAQIEAAYNSVTNWRR
ncbi:MAG: Uroporphyrinogen-III decarboxylase [Sporomusa sp.]|nr:Uroporphyrinogen-III decarboxylase [Sporomusa sp.]